MLSMDFIKRHRVDVERAVRDKGVAVDLDALLRFFLSQPSWSAPKCPRPSGLKLAMLLSATKCTPP